MHEAYASQKCTSTAQDLPSKVHAFRTSFYPQILANGNVLFTNAWVTDDVWHD